MSTLNQQFYSLTESVNHNVLTFVDVQVNEIKETVILIFKNNLHTKSGKILKFSDIDTDFQKIKVIKEFNFKK